MTIIRWVRGFHVVGHHGILLADAPADQTSIFDQFRPSMRAKVASLPSQALCIHQQGAGATAPLREDLTREWNIHINFVGQMAIGERSLRLVKQR